MTPRTYLITASTGIGAETARQLARLGHNLFIVSRTRKNVQALAAELATFGGRVGAYAGDLTQAKTAPRAVANCVRQFGRLDGLFNVAGISARKYGDGPLHQCSELGWATVITANLTSQYRMSREALRVMLTQKPHRESGQRGVILNMASILGIHPEPKHFSAIGYAASKGGITAMTRAAAAFYAAKKIRLNAIAPALVQTPMSARAAENSTIRKFIQSKQPLTGGMIPGADAAAASVFLLTDASRSITGEVLEVDGGWNLV